MPARIALALDSRAAGWSAVRIRCGRQAVLGDGPAGLVGVPARDGRDEAGVDLVPAAHLLRGGGVRGREDLEDPVPGTFGSGQAASVAVAWRYDGPRGPGR